MTVSLEFAISSATVLRKLAITGGSGGETPCRNGCSRLKAVYRHQTREQLSCWGRHCHNPKSLLMTSILWASQPLAHVSSPLFPQRASSLVFILKQILQFLLLNICLDDLQVKCGSRICYRLSTVMGKVYTTGLLLFLTLEN